VDSVSELARARDAQALLMTRLHHVLDTAGLRQAFAQRADDRLVSTHVIGYQLYASPPAPAERPGACRSRT
jgi:hypothetical protein